MLHKRFKSAKCKTALKLATSRIKLMKNKKGVQINQMKKELAQLLETGQDRTARIRVEHVIREEKIVAAYDLIEIYCELVVARLPIIDSQKTCPIDLKEAVTSVIFAAPRCSDITELADVKKQFTTKYGKEFVSAAIELHPNCGVSRMLVEKLSAVAPDLQTKIKVLTDVAKDYNVDWDPTSFEEKESKPPSDLVSVPASFENASVANVEPPKIQPVHSHEEKHSAPVDFSEQNRRYTQSTQNVTSTDGGETSSSGENNEWKEMKQNWNMEFKDATSAAQAAAESAERAAMAARAAAQFSSQEKFANRQPSGPNMGNNRDKPPHVSAPSGSSGESLLNDRKPRISNQDFGQSQDDTSQNATERIVGPHVANSIDKPHVSDPSGFSGQSSSDDRKPNIGQSRYDPSQKATERYDGSDNDSIEDGYFEESLHADEEAPSSPERESKTEVVSGQKENIDDENINFFATEKQPTIHSYHHHSSTSSEEPNIGKKSVVGNPFAVVDQESPFKETMKTNSNINDKAMSDDDNDDNFDDGGPRFDTGFEYDEIEATHSLEDPYMWNPNLNKVDQLISQSHIFSESKSFGDHSIKSVERSETDNHEPASFDHSDGPDSDSENELLSINSKPSYVAESSQTYNLRKSRIELDDLVEAGPSFDDEEKYELKKHSLDQESSETYEDHNDSLNQGLNFGTLTGGLKNKGGLRYPPYTKSATIEKSTEEPPVTGSQTSFQGSLDSRVSRIEDKKPKVSIPFSDSSFFNDGETDSEDDVPKQAPSKVRLGAGLSRRTRGSPSVAYSKTHVEPKPVPEPEPLSYFRKTVETGKTRSTTSEPQVNQFGHTKQEPFKTMSESKKPVNEHVSSRIEIESGKLMDENKTQNFGSEKVSGVKKPSHVHPKLPEYDSLAARLQFLRNDRQ
ncbi:uncharacterized protein LOC143555215 [Bidens hawaiensis]|uniref:uncharacterized protein LOC143555215 n=1 Tax=Bidens hawaiensis TaxID=980011 RepID=UPI0040499685